MRHKLFVLLIMVFTGFALFGCSEDYVLNAARNMAEDNPETPSDTGFSVSQGQNGEEITTYATVAGSGGVTTDREIIKDSDGNIITETVTVNSGSLGSRKTITNRETETVTITLTYRGTLYICKDKSFIPIADAVHLKNIKLGEDLFGDYCLAINISLEGNFKPIGDQNNPYFLGTLDGQGKTITGLKIAQTADEIGLFKNIGREGEVKNLTIKNPSVEGGNDTGVLAGNNEGTITNVHIVSDSTSDTVKVKGAEDVGGLVGYNDGDITNSSSSVAVVSITGVNASAGGLVGSNSRDITNSSSSGTVTVTGSSVSYTGGLVGSNSEKGNIINSFAIGAVIATESSVSSYTGGLVGDNDGGITNSSSSGTVTVTGDSASYTGGLVGDNNGEITDSYATGPVTVEGTQRSLYLGGLVGSNNGGITTSYAIGAVIITMTVTANGQFFNVAGFVGLNSGGNITNSYFDKTGTKRDLGIGGPKNGTSVPQDGVTRIDPSITSTDISGGGVQPFTNIDVGWEFPSIWVAQGDGIWPILAWQQTP